MMSPELQTLTSQIQKILPQPGGVLRASMMVMEIAHKWSDKTMTVDSWVEYSFRRTLGYFAARARAVIAFGERAYKIHDEAAIWLHQRGLAAEHLAAVLNLIDGEPFWLTTPPQPGVTSLVMRWHLLDKIIPIAQLELEKAKKLMPADAKPVESKTIESTSIETTTQENPTMITVADLKAQRQERARRLFTWLTFTKSRNFTLGKLVSMKRAHDVRKFGLETDQAFKLRAHALAAFGESAAKITPENHRDVVTTQRLVTQLTELVDVSFDDVEAGRPVKVTFRTERINNTCRVYYFDVEAVAASTPVPSVAEPLSVPAPVAAPAPVLPRPPDKAPPPANPKNPDRPPTAAEQREMTMQTPKIATKPTKARHPSKWECVSHSLYTTESGGTTAFHLALDFEARTGPFPVGPMTRRFTMIFDQKNWIATTRKLTELGLRWRKLDTTQPRCSWTLDPNSPKKVLAALARPLHETRLDGTYNFILLNGEQEPVDIVRPTDVHASDIESGTFDKVFTKWLDDMTF